MGISCGATLIKYLLFFFNLIWLGLGGVVIYLGFRITNFSGDIEELVDVNLKAGAIYCLVAGFVIFLIAFLGCCGAIAEKSCLLSTYGLLILILVIVQCVGAYLAFRYRSDIKEQLTDKIRTEFSTYKNRPQVVKLVQEIQSQFECCGADGYKDYGDSGFLPASCCGKSFSDNEQAICAAADVQYKDGCVNLVEDQVTKYLGGLGWVVVGLVLIQLIIIVSAYCLAREVSLPKY